MELTVLWQTVIILFGDNMLKDELNYLFEKLDLNVGEIAAFAKTDITNISRLKSGARSPKPESRTVEKLINGIIDCCESKGRLNELDEMISSDKANRRETLLLFLFKDYQSPNPQTLSSFPGKLRAIMKLCGISNSALAKRINVDSSYISRIKNGSRAPKAGSELYEAICRELFDEIANQGKQSALKNAINSQSEEGSPEIYYDFKSWLYDSVSGDIHIKSLLESISSIELKAEIPSEIMNMDFSYEEKGCYYGISGIQEASIRFLTEVTKSDAKEIYLYSDRNIDWMISDREFAMKWAYLMYRLVSNGIKIKIIHNVDRKLPDMVNALKSWLPIYMSCCIEPYYASSKVGNRFTHTLFVCPGVACVKAFNLPDDQNPDFDYYKDAEHIDKCADIFNQMLKKSAPLIYVRKGASRSKRATVIKHEFDNIEISFDDFSVTVTRLNEPKVSFTIANNMLSNAIKAYCAAYEASVKEEQLWKI